MEKIIDNPELGYFLRRFLEKQEEGGNVSEKSLMPVEALSLILDRDLSREDYNVMYNTFKKKGFGIPSYDRVRDVKSECRPEGIKFSIEDIQVPLQQMANHRMQRILQLEKVKIRVTECIEKTGGPLELVYNIKIGLDGSSGFQVIQKLVEGGYRDEGALLASTFVSINVVTVVDNRLVDVYVNNAVNSSYGCAPLRHWFRRETDETLEVEISRLQDEINNLQPLQTSDDVTVRYCVHFTMLDQKVMNHIHRGSSQRCPLCLATPMDFMNVTRVFTAKPEAVAQLCLSILHFGPRSMENLFNIGFNQLFQKFQRRRNNTSDYFLRALMKQKILASYLKDFGWKIFKPGNGGTSNTGNMARNVFKNSIYLAEQIGVDEDLVHRIHMVWIALASGEHLCADKFGRYCEDTIKLYHREAHWYPMCASLHKVLVHAKDVIRLLPPEITAGMLSEEPAEASNKDVKNFEQHHAFQGDYVKKALAVFHRLIDRSDPIVASFYETTKVFKRELRRRELPDDVQWMLLTPEEVDQRRVVE